MSLRIAAAQSLAGIALLISPLGQARLLSAAASNRGDSRQQVAPRDLTRKEVLKARRQYRVEILTYDPERTVGSGWNAGDMVRLRVTNRSPFTLSTLTVAFRRYTASGEMIGMARTWVPVNTIKPGQSAEFDQVVLGRLDGVTRMTATVESHISKRDEQFIHELSDPQSGEHSTTKARSSSPRIGIGTLADSILRYRGRATAVTQRGSDAQGLVVAWTYPDAVYLLGRRESHGVTAYRVIAVERSSRH